MIFIFVFLNRKPNWKEAAKFYEKYIFIRENETTILDEDSGTSETPAEPSSANGVPFHDQHDIVARLAYLYKTGENDLECNYQRAG